jgi:NADPH:quinone reductase-like Zn-dependent oxidoreductase
VTETTMWAAVIDRLGASPTYREINRPTSAPGQVLVQVSAAALNPVDLRIASGGFYGGVPECPYIPGSEGVGVVTAGSRQLLGKRVRFETRGSASGALAEWAAVDQTACLPIPDQLPSATGAALGVAGMAAWISLVDKVRLQRGERVLILGATGPVGQLGVQIARLLGAGRIVAAGRDPQVLAKTLELGADAVVAIAGQTVEDLQAEFTAAAGGPLQVVFDPVWGIPLQAAVAASGQSARIVNLGQSAGAEATLSSAIVRGRQLTIVGHSNPNTSWKGRANAFRELADHAERGRIRIEVEELPLPEVASAWARQASSPHAKLVLVPSP